MSTKNLRSQEPINCSLFLKTQVETIAVLSGRVATAQW